MTDVLSLSWDNFHQIVSSELDSFLEHEDLVDVTLAAQGKYIKAHKIVLSMCSPYFKELFKNNPCQHPIIFMKDVSYQTLMGLLEFMYKGEAKIKEENLKTFISTAEALEIKALMKASNDSCHDVTPEIRHFNKEELSNKTNCNDKTDTFPIDLTESDDNTNDDLFEDVSMTASGTRARRQEDEIEITVANHETVEEVRDYYEYVLNSERPDRLLFHQRIYVPCRINSEIKNWRCFKPNCNATCKTQNGEVIGKMGLHNHPIPKKILSQMRKKEKADKRTISGQIKKN